jgi:hypothetical protein
MVSDSANDPQPLSFLGSSLDWKDGMASVEELAQSLHVRAIFGLL